MTQLRIKKAVIENFKCFEGRFSAEFNNGVNIIVGDNESGKSTILEAVNLALSGILNGRYLKNELSQYLFNYNVVGQYLTEVNNGKKPNLPEIENALRRSAQLHISETAFSIATKNEKGDKEGVVNEYYNLMFHFLL